jgi:hypothetical protein
VRRSAPSATSLSVATAYQSPAAARRAASVPPRTTLWRKTSSGERGRDGTPSRPRAADAAAPTRRSRAYQTQHQGRRISDALTQPRRGKSAKARGPIEQRRAPAARFFPTHQPSRRGRGARVRSGRRTLPSPRHASRRHWPRHAYNLLPSPSRHRRPTSPTARPTTLAFLGHADPCRAAICLCLPPFPHLEAAPPDPR